MILGKQIETDIDILNAISQLVEFHIQFGRPSFYQYCLFLENCYVFRPLSSCERKWLYDNVMPHLQYN